MRERQFIPRSEGDLKPTQAELEGLSQRSKGKRRKRLAMTAAAAAGLLIGGEPAQAQSKLQTIGAIGTRAGEIAAGVIQTGQWTKTERERIAAERQARLEEQRTRRQDQAIGGAVQGGWKGAKVTTRGGETTIDVTEGATPPERMQAKQLEHAETMAGLELIRERENRIHNEITAAMATGDTVKVNRLTGEWMRLQQERQEREAKLTAERLKRLGAVQESK
jgi:hypothetical protein